MTRNEIAKLVGAYATGTLTPAEREALFTAALDDQALFDALAREQSLQDLLADPAARAHLLAALDDPPLPWHSRVTRWVWGHAVGVGAVACFFAMAGYMATQLHFAGPRVRLVADAPETVEVTGAAPAKPRQFDMGSLKRPVNIPDLPPPPAAPRAADSRSNPTLLALAAPPVLPPRPAPLVAPPAVGMPFTRLQEAAPPTAVSAPRTNFTVDGVVALDAGAQARAASEQVSVTAAATPIQTASSESSKLVDSSQMANITMKGRDLFSILQTVPGISFGNNLLAGAPGARSLFYESAGAAAGGGGGAVGGMFMDGGNLSDAGLARGGRTAAVLTGTVADPAGAAVPNAQVQLKNIATGAVITTRSNSEGAFRFENLPPARYALTASASGFQVYTQPDINLSVAQSRDVGRVALAVGAVTESVSVMATAAATPVQTAKAEAKKAVAPSAPPQRAAGMGGAPAAQTRATLLGRVVDPGGAAVPNARARIRNVATGAILDTLTNSDGVFVMISIFPARYDLGIARYRNDLTLAPGAVFQGYVQKNIDVAGAGTRDLGRIELTSRTLAEEPWVTDVRAVVQPGGSESSRSPSNPRDLPLRRTAATLTTGAPTAPPVGRVVDPGSAATSNPGARTPGLRYQVLRLLPNGDYETIVAESLAKGDTIKLRFVPNMAGYLHVAEPGARTPLLQTRVERMAEATTPAIKVGGSGRREFLVAFSAQEQPAASYEAAAIRSAAATVRTETVAQERATYVVGVAAASFVIALDFK